MENSSKSEENADTKMKNDVAVAVTVSRRTSRRQSRKPHQVEAAKIAYDQDSITAQQVGNTKRYEVIPSTSTASTASKAKKEDKHSETLIQKIKVDNVTRRKSASASVLNQSTTNDILQKQSAAKKPKVSISNSNIVDINGGSSTPDINQAKFYASDSNLSSTRKTSKKKSKSGSESSIKKKKFNEGSAEHIISPLHSALTSTIPESQLFGAQKEVDDIEKILDEITADSPLKNTRGSVDVRKKKSKKTDDHLTGNHDVKENVEILSSMQAIPEKTKSVESSNESLSLRNEDSIMSFHIYKTDSLLSEMNLKHPLVRIHVIDINTGHYLSKSDHSRKVTSPREPAHVTYILPSITKPFNMLDTKTPSWNQKIVLNEKYLHIAADPEVIIFFEILDFVSNLKALRRYPDGWNRIAWGFLKPVAMDGKPTTNQDVRLQLYKYPWSLFPYAPPKLSPIPFVYTCYKQTWKKYSSTLYVKVAAHKPLEVPTIKMEEKISVDQLLSKMKLMNKQDNGMKNILAISSIKPKWRRKQGDPCRLPNRLLYRIDAGQKGSFSCCFSNNGYLMAIAGVNQSSYPIKIYKIDTGERIATLEGHQDLIYQLNWSKNDTQLISASSDGSTRIWNFAADGSVRQSSILQHPTFVYATVFHPTKEDPRVVVTGAYDGSIRFWNSTTNSGIVHQTNTPELILTGHRSNINSICFDSDGSRLYSGDGSGLIKIWSSEAADDQLRYECIKTVDSLKGHPIQALRLHPSNRKLMAQTIGPNLHMLDTRIHRILTHFQLPSSKKFELESTLPSVQAYPKLFNSVINEISTAKQQLNSIHQISSARFLKCSFSACGTYVFVGSANGSVHFWRSESGSYLGTYNSQVISSWSQGNYPIVDISFHPHDHMIAFAIWGDKEPVRVYTWDKKLPDIKTQEAEPEAQRVKHLNVDKLVSSSMADLIGDFPIGIRTKKNWIKPDEVPSDMIALISPSSLL